MLVATDKDRDHIHTHFVINSVCAADGRKLHTSASDLQAIGSPRAGTQRSDAEAGQAACNQKNGSDMLPPLNHRF